MKSRFRIITLCLIFLFVSGSVLTVQANTSSNAEINATGLSMSATDFKNTFSGTPATRTQLSRAKSINNSSISISNIKINEDSITFLCSLTNNNTISSFQVKGTLFSSRKTQHGINSIIVDIPNQNSNYSFLLFEIFNDTKSNNLLVSDMNNSKNLLSKPHIKIYLQDKNGNVYLYETEMPSALSKLVATDYKTADKYKDLLWANELVKHETKELQTNESILQTLNLTNTTRGLNTWTTWQSPTTYYDTFYLGSEIVQSYSLPYMEYRHVNVRSQDSTWCASFKVAEHTNISGLVYHGTNIFEYRNLKLAFACGDKSIFIRTFQEGRLNKFSPKKGLKEAGDSIAVKLFNKAVNHLPYGSTIQTVLAAVNTMLSSDGTVVLGNSSTALYTGPTVAVGESLVDTAIEECTNYDNSNNIGHYFTYQGILQYEESSGNTNTVGALVMDFDVYNSTNYHSAVSESFQLNYSSQP